MTLNLPLILEQSFVGFGSPGSGMVERGFHQFVVAGLVVGRQASFDLKHIVAGRDIVQE